MKTCTCKEKSVRQSEGDKNYDATKGKVFLSIPDRSRERGSGRKSGEKRIGFVQSLGLDIQTP